MKKHLTLKNLGWLFTIAVVYMLGSAAVYKLIESEEMVKNFEFMHLSKYLIAVGLMEFAAVWLLVIPRTSVYGAIAITSIMSGALAMHLSLMGGAGLSVPVMIILFSWLAHCLRKYTK